MATLLRRSVRSTAVVSLVGYLGVFAVLTYAWWSTATYAVAPGNDPRDARLIVWILGWVSHALVHAPAKVFDAPIFFPAPGQLAGSEHLMSAQLLFAPAYWATGNAVLAANLVALLSYPASAFAMERLLAAQGLGRGAAWFGGLTFALGVIRVPASLQVLQYLTLFLPLVALRVQRLRERPRAREFGLLAVSLLAAMFSSYYLAVLVVITTLLWGTFELTRCESHRARFVTLVGAALVAASLALASVSGAYLHRSMALDPSRPSLDAFWGSVGRIALVAHLHDPIWLGLAALAIAGAATSLRAGGSRRALAATSLAFIVLGATLLALGWPSPLARWLEFFRVRARYLLLSSFGSSLLVAQGFDLLRVRLPSRLGGMLLLAAVTGSLVLARIDEVAPRSDPVLAASRDRELYRRLGMLVREHGGGPLLEVPFISNAVSNSLPEAMVGQIQHGLPLIAGFTGYRPDHHALLVGLITTLPMASSLDDLVDLTHLRWILVRPADEWPAAAARQAFLDGLSRYPALGPSWTIGPWILWRLDRVPSHQAWFAWIAAGPQPRHSVLGTSLEPIPEGDAIASVATRATPARVVPRWFVAIEAVARNRGTVAWPTWVAGGSSVPGLVQWEVRWRRVDGSNADWGPATTFALRRDVPPGEALTQTMILRTPEEPGSYELRIGVRQKDGARFSTPGNEIATLHVDVVASKMPPTSESLAR